MKLSNRTEGVSNTTQISATVRIWFKGYTNYTIISVLAAIKCKLTHSFSERFHACNFVMHPPKSALYSHKEQKLHIYNESFDHYGSFTHYIKQLLILNYI